VIRSPRKMGLIFFPAFDWAISPTHPEREERLLYTQDQILEEGVLDIEGITEFRPLVAAADDIEKAHFCVPDVASQTTESHLISAGGAMKAAEIVCEKKVERSFALVRPPGHHAMRVVHGNRGFCNINIEAVMIEHMRDNYGIKKIAVVDTDCHHGDGTQDIYWHDPDVLFISLHQDGRTLYPGSGFVDEMGGPSAYGYTLNVPLPPQTSDDGYLYVIENLVMPVLEDFKPDIIVNSAGQDNHYSDPITNMMLSAQGYATLNAKLHPHIAVLEGGYSIEDALPYVNLGIILAMAGLDYSSVREPDYDRKVLAQNPRLKDNIARVADDVLNRWKTRKEAGERLLKGKSHVERERVIFYDTDGIREVQREKLRVCHHCSGYLRLESSSDRGQSIVAIHIPAGACGACRKEGHDNFACTEKGGHDAVFLQDRAGRLFERK
jgi:acetoin utilization deacetylase AcuC-like enzyme